eukprot:scaffold1505_cov256-Pinguiococcus_pyrenoidosus.AAC.5
MPCRGTILRRRLEDRDLRCALGGSSCAGRRLRRGRFLPCGSFQPRKSILAGRFNVVGPKNFLPALDELSRNDAQVQRTSILDEFEVRVAPLLCDSRIHEPHLVSEACGVYDPVPLLQVHGIVIRLHVLGHFALVDELPGIDSHGFPHAKVSLREQAPLPLDVAN